MGKKKTTVKESIAGIGLGGHGALVPAHLNDPPRREKKGERIKGT